MSTRSKLMVTASVIWLAVIAVLVVLTLNNPVETTTTTSPSVNGLERLDQDPAAKAAYDRCVATGASRLSCLPDTVPATTTTTTSYEWRSTLIGIGVATVAFVVMLGLIAVWVPMRRAEPSVT